MKKIRPLVFLPPFLLLLGAVVLNFLDKDAFTISMTNANDGILKVFGKVFAVAPFLMLVTCVAIFFSPFGRVTIGGPDAKPLLSKFRWFAITLCTTIAIGILFWATAEPMFHLSAPPESLGIAPNSAEAATFALDTLLLHWTFTPYAIYAITGLMFAFAYYNMRKPFSLGSPLSPILGKHAEGYTGQVIDSICLFCLVAGMAGSLGAGLLLMSGGIAHMWGINGSPLVWGIIAAIIVGSFTISAITGLMKGIRVLSAINTVFLFALLIFVFIFGPTKHILLDGVSGAVHAVANFVQRNVWTATTSDVWASQWTIFYWANWFAWAPISVAFLGRISYGHSVRSFLTVNLLLPAVFTGVWMVVFGTSAIHMELFKEANLVHVLNLEVGGGAEGVLYAFLSHFPLAQVLVPVFLIATFLSFVTAADSNTSAMGGLSSTGISPESPEPSVMIKVVWGAMIGLIAWIMISFAHIDGIRMLSNLGGLPALFLCSGAMVCVIMVAINPGKYDTFGAGYDDAGKPLKKDQRNT